MAICLEVHLVAGKGMRARIQLQDEKVPRVNDIMRQGAMKWQITLIEKDSANIVWIYLVGVDTPAPFEKVTFLPASSALTDNEIDTLVEYFKMASLTAHTQLEEFEQWCIARQIPVGCEVESTDGAFALWWDKSKLLISDSTKAETPLGSASLLASCEAALLIDKLRAELIALMQRHIK